MCEEMQEMDAMFVERQDLLIAIAFDGEEAGTK